MRTYGGKQFFFLNKTIIFESCKKMSSKDQTTAVSFHTRANRFLCHHLLHVPGRFAVFDLLIEQRVANTRRIVRKDNLANLNKNLLFSKRFYLTLVLMRVEIVLY